MLVSLLRCLQTWLIDCVSMRSLELFQKISQRDGIACPSTEATSLICQMHDGMALTTKICCLRACFCRLESPCLLCFWTRELRKLSLSFLPQIMFQRAGSERSSRSRLGIWILDNGGEMFESNNCEIMYLQSFSICLKLKNVMIIDWILIWYSLYHFDPWICFEN